MGAGGRTTVLTSSILAGLCGQPGEPEVRIGPQTFSASLNKGYINTVMPKVRIKVKGTGKTVRVLPSNAGSMPAAYQRQMKARLSVSHSRNGVRVSGWDLVQPLPDVIAAEGGQIFAAIVCNPCYWLGTRISALAATYQNYRPIKLRFHYVPQVAVTYSGTVIVGTRWNTSGNRSSLQQSLVTSNGGNMCQCYVPFTTSITLGSNLPQNLFTCAGNLDEDHNPFVFLAMVRGATVVPGYFFVEYTFDLKNPLGYSVGYESQQITTPDYGPVRQNRMLIALDSVPGFSGPGTVYDLEANGDVMYDGTLVAMPSGIPAILLTNQPVGPASEFEEAIRSIIITDSLSTVGASINTKTNYAYWNWSTDGNGARGTFASTGTSPISFRRLAWDRIAAWIQGLGTGVTRRLYVYALNVATMTIGNFITSLITADGNVNAPSILFKIAEGGTYNGMRYGFDKRPPPPRSTAELSPGTPAEPTAEPDVFF